MTDRLSKNEEVNLGSLQSRSFSSLGSSAAIRLQVKVFTPPIWRMYMRSGGDVGWINLTAGVTRGATDPFWIRSPCQQTSAQSLSLPLSPPQPALCFISTLFCPWQLPELRGTSEGKWGAEGQGGERRHLIPAVKQKGEINPAAPPSGAHRRHF